jgi:hypothetical protein
MTIVAVPPTAIMGDGAMAALKPTLVAAQAPQGLIEYLAAVNPNALASGANPSQLGEDMVKNLKGFFDRSQSMTSRARALADPTPAPHAAMTMVHRGPAQAALDPGTMQIGPQQAKGQVDGHQMDRVIQSLGMMFDYSIETQLVVRGATQVSGAANTLLRGQ